MKKSLVPILLVAGLTGLTGCANNDDNNRNNIRTTDVRDNVRTTDIRNNVNLPDNNRLKISRRAARNVEGLAEVDHAHVILRGNDAYVAVRLNDRAGKTGARNTDNGNTAFTRDTNRSTRNTDIIGARGIYGTNKYNATNDTTGLNGTNGTYGTTGLNGTTGTTGLNGTNGTYGTAGLNGMNRTTGTTGLNGTNGTTGTRDFNNGTYSRVDTAFEKRVADQVRKAHRGIHRVYVSTDNNFYNRMTTYSDDIQNGRNRNGVFRDFSNNVRDLFNNNR
jgi:hypothetical protein